MELRLSGTNLVKLGWIWQQTTFNVKLCDVPVCVLKRVWALKYKSS